MSRVNLEPNPLESQSKVGEVIKTAVHTLGRPFREAIQRIFPRKRSTRQTIIRVYDPLRTVGNHPGSTFDLPQKPKD